jgi:hypothetical protein
MPSLATTAGSSTHSRPKRASFSIVFWNPARTYVLKSDVGQVLSRNPERFAS